MRIDGGGDTLRGNAPGSCFKRCVPGSWDCHSQICDGERKREFKTRIYVPRMKGLSSSITRLHNVTYPPFFSSVISMALKHNAQLVLSEVGGRGFSGTEASTARGWGVQREGLLQL